MEWIVYKRNKQSNARIIVSRTTPSALTQSRAITLAYELNSTNADRRYIYGCCSLQSDNNWTEKIEAGAV